MRRKTGKGISTLGLGEEDFKHMLLDCLETIKWRMKF
jgi:hypothetical protein